MSSRPTVLLTNAIHADGEALLKPQADLFIAADTRPETLRAAVRDVDGVIVRAQLPDDIADNAPRLKGLVRHGVGLDFIPVDNATRNGVMVANLPGINTQAVVEYFFAALFHLRRPLGRIDARLRVDGWNVARPMADTATEIGGSTLGILGVGAIGSAIAHVARGFGMSVLGHDARPIADRAIEPVSLEDLFGRSDVISINCALTETTRGIVDARLIGLMKPTAVLLNMARGPVVVTAALVEALRDGAIAGAATDVYDTHPVPADSPLFACPNLLMTPHIAAVTASAMRAMSVGAAEEMLRILAGERPRHLVNPDCLKR
jgi:D-3-phosphoglycerate dehydrogenase